MSELQKRHAAAVDILAKLGLDYVRLEPQRGDRYTYRAWNAPIVEHNGQAKTVKRGRIRVPPALNANFPNRSSGK
jgi:hypothetical protein